MNNLVPCHKCAVLSTFAPVRLFKCSDQEWGTMTGAGQAVAGLLIPPSVCIDELKAPAWVAAAGLSLMLMGFRCFSDVALISRKII